ncbi:hypothetical protein OG552_31755 [Streptomyces sp. NBC_01476]|uniref:hypothetical protein n=1 Tax=Streptomyces sp. NBC_01476 TaxID=2903881 RepID=UPI002E3199C4|nr:hypothetical protein [Streptomyces sp. NBC_01476]
MRPDHGRDRRRDQVGGSEVGGSGVGGAIRSDRPGPAFSTALADGTGYAELSCGSHDFGRGATHTVTFTVLSPATGTGPAAYADIELDYLALRA